MGALDACAHRATSDAQMSGRMAKAARDNVCALANPLPHGDNMHTYRARNILLPIRCHARVALRTDLALVDASWQGCKLCAGMYAAVRVAAWM